MSTKQIIMIIAIVIMIIRRRKNKKNNNRKPKYPGSFLPAKWILRLKFTTIRNNIINK